MIRAFEHIEASVVEQFERCKPLAGDFLYRSATGQSASGIALHAESAELSRRVSDLHAAHGQSGMNAFTSLFVKCVNKQLDELTLEDVAEAREMVLLGALLVMGMQADPIRASADFAEQYVPPEDPDRGHLHKCPRVASSPLRIVVDLQYNGLGTLVDCTSFLFSCDGDHDPGR
jgi:hypothetical protein